SGFFFPAFVALWKTKLKSFGWRVMLVALALLTLNHLQYFLMFAFRNYVVLPFEYFTYNSIIDLALQTMLGFGMVIVLLEQVLTDAKRANEKLRKAHEKLEVLANIDPLTTALNRHAFHGYIKQRGTENKTVSGCVGFFDIDNLKEINERHGHAQGDGVIRLVVRAIRNIIRAEDLIFRWGGDEFFVIMIGIDSEFANARIHNMEQMLSNVLVEGIKQSISIGVSHAFEDFSDLNDLEGTIRRADAGMYRQKQIRKGRIVTDVGKDVRSEREILIGRREF
ncbi:MAG: GGDEF domain-containing protein, partial [Pyrinomonadaceae bacterium]